MHGIFLPCIVFEFFEKYKFLEIFKKVSQVAILKIEHCSFLDLVTYLFLYNNCLIDVLRSTVKKHSKLLQVILIPALD